MLHLSVTIFLSAFLLFQVQPLIAKYILPWFGGGPAVWTACMLFFQVVLLGGYAYAHLISTRLSARAGGAVHIAALLVSFAFLPITPEAAIWKRADVAEPTGFILWLLLANVGVPYFLLSSTTPLVQRWFSQKYPEHSPYRLYALSNSGSLLALLTYPFIVEPAFSLSSQVNGWSVAYGGFVVLCAWSAWRGMSAGEAAGSPRGNATTAAMAVKSIDVLMWLGLAAAGSVMLLATTNQMSQEVAVVPFLWVIPLALYLLTFIITFEHERWYNRFNFGLLLGVSAIVATAILFAGVFVPLWAQILVYAVTMFACCMTCHGELYRSRPDPAHLTLFYLVVSGGGALGGFFVAAVAPTIFIGYWEYHVGLIGCILLTLVAWFRGGVTVGVLGRKALYVRLGLMLAALALVLFAHVQLRARGVVEASRNFYGVLKVGRSEGAAGEKLDLMHGRILHGEQYQDPEKRKWPTAYYGPKSGVGLAIQHHPRRQTMNSALKIGVVGLGVGTVSAYGRADDTIRFYEINPEVIRLAAGLFTYNADSEARIEVVLGDARVQLEHELTQQGSHAFDVLAIDAFSSDAIPIHLITREAVEVYWKHLAKDGILTFHISNRSLDLTPVTRALGEICRCEVVRTQSPEDARRGVKRATWVLLTTNRVFLDSPAVREAAVPWTDEDKPPLFWTDDFASLWQVLKW